MRASGRVVSLRCRVRCACLKPRGRRREPRKGVAPLQSAEVPGGNCTVARTSLNGQFETGRVTNETGARVPSSRNKEAGASDGKQHEHGVASFSKWRQRPNRPEFVHSFSLKSSSGLERNQQ